MPVRTIIEPFRIKSVEVILKVWRNRQRNCGMRLTYEAPLLRHFTAHLEPVGTGTQLQT